MDYQKIADRLKKTNDADFQYAVDTAVETLSSILGYPLITSGSTEKRMFPIDPYAIWHRVNPFYDLTSVRLNDGTVSELLENKQLGQNGVMNGSWHNGFRVCGCFTLCHCRVSQCVYLDVDAEWGFGPQITDEDKNYVYLPADLTSVLDAMLKESLDPRTNIKSESRGSRSYTKFESKPVVVTHAPIINKYRMQ